MIIPHKAMNRIFILPHIIRYNHRVITRRQFVCEVLLPIVDSIYLQVYQIVQVLGQVARIARIYIRVGAALRVHNH